MHSAGTGMTSYLAISDLHSLNFFLCLKHLDHSLHLLLNLDSPKPTITNKTMSCWYQNFFPINVSTGYGTVCVHREIYTLFFYLPGRNKAINLRLKTLHTDQCKKVNIMTVKILSSGVLVYCFILVAIKCSATMWILNANLKWSW